MKQIDILHIISGDLWAGAEVQVFHTLVFLKKQSKLSFTVALFNDGILNQRLLENGIDTFIIDENKKNWMLMLLMLTRLISRLRPSIVHVHAFKEHILGQIASYLNRSKVTIIRTFHGMSEVPKGLSYKKYIKLSIVHKIEKYFLNHSDRTNIIAVSKDLQRFLTTSFHRAVITQIYNAIPISLEKLVPKECIREKYNVANNTFWIGTIARLSEPKNLGLLIDAGRELLLTGVNFKISIWGDGPLRNNLQKQIDQYNIQKHISLEGFESNILPVLNSIDLFVLCSLHEGLPMSLLEAMSVNTPVVCTAVGGMEEVIKDNYSGLLIPNNDVMALTSAIVRLHQDTTLRERLVMNANKKVKQEFNIENTNNKLIDLYGTILND